MGAHRDEDSPLVDGDASAIDGDYPALKRGAELGVLASFPEAVMARAGLILGPYEDIGRLPWWLARIAEGGPVVAPGRPRRPLQYIDVRDLTNWILHALTTGRQGPIDVISRSGHATTEHLLTACKDATGVSSSISLGSTQAVRCEASERFWESQRLTSSIIGRNVMGLCPGPDLSRYACRSTCCASVSRGTSRGRESGDPLEPRLTDVRADAPPPVTP